MQLWIIVAFVTALFAYGQNSMACPKDSGVRTLGLAIMVGAVWTVVLPLIAIGGEQVRREIVEGCGP